MPSAPPWRWVPPGQHCPGATGQPAGLRPTRTVGNKTSFLKELTFLTGPLEKSRTLRGTRNLILNSEKNLNVRRHSVARFRRISERRTPSASELIILTLTERITGMIASSWLHPVSEDFRAPPRRATGTVGSLTLGPHGPRLRPASNKPDPDPDGPDLTPPKRMSTDDSEMRPLELEEHSNLLRH